MSALAEKLRKAREVRVEVGDFTFTVRRPTDLEMIELNKANAGRAILPFVVGWGGVTELAMLGTGAPHPVDFDADACAEWLEDRIDLLSEIVNAVFKAYEDHQKKLADAVKN